MTERDIVERLEHWAEGCAEAWEVAPMLERAIADLQAYQACVRP